MTRARPLITFAVLTSLAVAGSFGGSSEAATATRATLVLSQPHPVAREAFTASGRVSTRFKRPVVLRVKVGSRWRNVRRGATTSTGTYRFAGLSTARVNVYSVLVPSAKHARKTYRKATTPARRAVPVAQGGTLEVLPPVAQRGVSPTTAGAAKNAVVARFTPARPGRKVTFLRRLPGGRWTVAATTTQGADGSAYYFGASRTGAGAISFQARTAAQRGAAALSSPTAVDRWQQSFSDEFPGTSLDTGTSARAGKWSYREGAAPSRTLSTNDKRAVSVAQGTLRMQIKRDPTNAKKLLSAQVSTQGTFAFKYGMASARIRFERDRGQHGSFWMQSPTYGAYPGNPARSGAEVDTVEFFGRGYPQGGLANFLYYADANRSTVKIGAVQPHAASLAPRSDRWWNSYHVFSVNWTPKGYTFYVDGRVLYTSARAISGAYQYLVLSLLVSDWEAKDLDRNALPTATARQWAPSSTMSVDWAKVWETRGSS
jgi:beta-glucanase (GH16 family)